MAEDNQFRPRHPGQTAQVTPISPSSPASSAATASIEPPDYDTIKPIHAAIDQLEEEARKRFRGDYIFASQKEGRNYNDTKKAKGTAYADEMNGADFLQDLNNSDNPQLYDKVNKFIQNQRDGNNHNLDQLKHKKQGIEAGKGEGPSLPPTADALKSAEAADKKYAQAQEELNKADRTLARKKAQTEEKHRRELARIEKNNEEEIEKINKQHHAEIAAIDKHYGAGGELEHKTIPPYPKSLSYSRDGEHHADEQKKAAHDKAIAQANKEQNENLKTAEEKRVKELKIAEENRETEIKGANTDARKDMFTALDHARDGVHQSDVSEAQAKVGDAKTNQEREQAQARVDEEQLRAAAPKSSTQQLAQGAAQYKEDTKAGEDARKALYAKSMENFRNGVETEINKKYDAKLAVLNNSRDPNAQEKIEDLNAQKTAEIAALNDRVEKLAPHVKELEGKIASSGKSETDKKELRKKMYEFAAQWDGKNADGSEKSSGEFYTEFLHKNTPSLAPARVQQLVDDYNKKHPGQEVDPNKVFAMTVKGDSIVLHAQGEERARDDIVITGPLANQVKKNGVDVKGMPGAFVVEVDQHSGVDKDHKLLLVNSDTVSDIKTRITTGGSSVNHEKAKKVLAGITSPGGSDTDLNTQVAEGQTRQDNALEREGVAKQQGAANAAQIAELKALEAQNARGAEIARQEAIRAQQEQKQIAFYEQTHHGQLPPHVAAAAQGANLAGISRAHDVEHYAHTVPAQPAPGNAVPPPQRGKTG